MRCVTSVVIAEYRCGNTSKSKVWNKNEKIYNFESWFDHIGETQMFKIGRTLFSYWGQFDPKTPQKHPIFRGGPVPPKSYYFSKRFLPRDFSPRKPPIYEFWAHFFKIEILLRMTLLNIFLQLFFQQKILTFDHFTKMMNA